MKLPSSEQMNRPIPQGGGNVVGYSSMGAGAALAEVGKTMSMVASAELDRIDELRTEEAVNELRKRQADLTYGKDRGFMHVKGGDVVSRPMHDDYSRYFEDASNEISSKLGTERQRQIFKIKAGQIGAHFRTDVMRHVLSESDKYDGENFLGTVTVEKDNAVQGWADQNQTMLSRNRISDTVESFANRRGMGPDVKQALLKKHLSELHTGVVAKALDENNLARAEEYVTSNNKDMDVNTLIKVDGMVKKAKKLHLASIAADDVLAGAARSVDAPDFDRLNSLVLGKESNNKNYNADGSVVTSKKGAKYAQQVMPETAAAPGFGIEPAKNDSPEEYNRVGRQYLAAMLQKYGNVEQALAAYNAGPAAVDMAIAKAKNPRNESGKTWFENVPEETRDYVVSITNQYQRGVDNIRTPTLVELKGAVAKRLEGQPREVIDAAQSKVESRFNDMMASRNQQAEDVLVDIMSRVDSGEVTSYNDLTPQQLSVLGTKRVSAQSYIEGQSRRSDKALELSPVATTFYFSLKTDPVALKNTSISDIMALSSEIGNARVRDLLNTRSEYINKPEREQAAIVDSDQFRATALRFGFNPSKDNDKKELIIIKDRVEQSINSMQVELKRTLTRDEKDKLLKQSFTKLPEVQARWTGPLIGGAKTTMAMRGYELKNPENVVIPDNIKEEIKANAARYGKTLTESQMREVYVAYLTKQQMKDRP